jgi:hypothetical protein
LAPGAREVADSAQNLLGKTLAHYWRENDFDSLSSMEEEKNGS